jgi:hydrogenase nickel incorporation protein HypA/HybF
MAITESVVAAVSDRIGPERVARVVLEIGRLSGVVPDALHFCFEICAKGTILDGAALEIREIAGRAHCAACGADTTCYPISRSTSRRSSATRTT